MGRVSHAPHPGNGQLLSPTSGQTLGWSRCWARAGAMQGFKPVWRFWNTLSWMARSRLLWWTCQFHELSPWIDGEFVKSCHLFPSVWPRVSYNGIWDRENVMGNVSHGCDFDYMDFISSRNPRSIFKCQKLKNSHQKVSSFRKISLPNSKVQKKSWASTKV